MNIILLLSNMVLIIAITILWMSMLKIRSLTIYILGLYILAYANIVLIFEITGLFGAIGKTPVFVVQFLISIITGIIWYISGKPV